MDLKGIYKEYISGDINGSLPCPWQTVSHAVNSCSGPTAVCDRLSLLLLSTLKPKKYTEYIKVPQKQK